MILHFLRFADKEQKLKLINKVSFLENSDMPDIPNSVTSTEYCFYNCTNMVIFKNIP